MYDFVSHPFEVVGRFGGCLTENKTFQFAFPQISSIRSGKKLHSVMWHEKTSFRGFSFTSRNLSTVLISILFLYVLSWLFLFWRFMDLLNKNFLLSPFVNVPQKVNFFSDFYFHSSLKFLPSATAWITLLTVFFGPLDGNWLYDIITSRNIRAQCGKSAQHKKTFQRKKVISVEFFFLFFPRKLAPEKISNWRQRKTENDWDDCSTEKSYHYRMEKLVHVFLSQIGKCFPDIFLSRFSLFPPRSTKKGISMSLDVNSLR